MHASVLAKDPPAITLPAAKLDEYVGRYRAGPDLPWMIRREGEDILWNRLR